MKVNNEYYKNMRDVQEIPNHVYSRFYNNFIRNKLDINYPDILENLCEYAYNCRNFYSDLLRRDIRYYNSNNIDTVGDVFTNRGTIDINDEILNNINLIEGDYEYMRVSPRNMLQVLGTIMDTRPDGQLVFHPGRLERRRSYPQRR
jgi:hypothetical protein